MLVTLDPRGNVTGASRVERLPPNGRAQVYGLVHPPRGALHWHLQARKHPPPPGCRFLYGTGPFTSA
jgi:hypothetical protein